MREIGFYRLDDADSWSAKTPRIERGEDFYLYGNDIARGLDIYRFDWDAEESEAGGTWLTAAQALERVTQTTVDVTTDYRLSCLLAR